MNELLAVTKVSDLLTNQAAEAKANVRMLRFLSGQEMRGWRGVAHVVVATLKIIMSLQSQISELSRVCSEQQKQIQELRNFKADAPR
jgi:hypothetical protein